jgi:hypothetical protein
VDRVGPRVVERGEDLAGEAIVTDRLHRPLHPALVARVAHARRVDVKPPGLRVLEKRQRDPRGERIGLRDDRRRVIWNQDLEDPAEEVPRGFARFDGARGRLLEGRIDEAVARSHGREDPRAEPALVPDQRQPANPARIELELLAGCAVGNWDGRRRAAESQLEDGEAIERRIRQIDALADQQLANLREPEAVP